MTPVDRRPLGRTGLTVPALGLGGAAIGQQYGPVSAAEVADTVACALDAGIDFIDTSAYYGRGSSARRWPAAATALPSALRPAGDGGREELAEREVLMARG